jgi:DNA repair exonuclease SbcCD ATPase subunit
MTMTATAPAAPAPTTPAAIAQTPPTSAPAPAERSTTASRAASLRAKLEAEPPSEATEVGDAPAGTVAGTPPGSGLAPQAEASTPAAAGDDPKTKERAERLERIAQVRAKEQAAEQERQAKRQTKERDGEVEKLRARIAELEPLSEVFKDEESLLSYAEKKNMSAEKLVQWMRTRLSDPNAVAQRQAQTVEEKLRAEMKALQDRLDKTEQDRVEERKQAEETHALQQKTTTFLSEVQSKASTHWRTSKFQAKHGPNGLVSFANQFIAPMLSEGYSTTELHDHVEQLLDELEAFGGSGPAHEPPASGTSHPPKKNGAAEPATTLSNALTSGRESLVEEVPLHKLSREDRKRRLREKLDRE